MKKIPAILLSLALTLGLAACGGSGTSTAPASQAPASQAPASQAPASQAPASQAPASQAPASQAPASQGTPVKMGFIFLHDENMTYDLNFMNGAKEACEAAGVEYILKTNIPEGQECYETAMDLVDQGCNIIFADSFGHEDYMIQAAMECPEVQFCHATGTKAHTQNLANYHNAFASIFEGRYLAGIAAGLKLQEMIDQGKITADQAKMGYVGAFTYAEIISGYSSFFLGARTVVPQVTMDVTFTGSWGDLALETEACQKLIDSGCVLISQHADTMGAPSTCEKNGVPNVSYNGSTMAAGPNTYIICSRINWAPYFTYIIDCVRSGQAIVTDYSGDVSTGSVQLGELNEAVAAPDTAKILDEVAAQLASGDRHVFDVNTFTVNGASVETYTVEGKEVVSDGYFHESEVMSAPYFDLQIDGINLLDTNFG